MKNDAMHPEACGYLQRFQAVVSRVAAPFAGRNTLSTARLKGKSVVRNEEVEPEGKGDRTFRTIREV
jgi:hypothetical protein